MADPTGAPDAAAPGQDHLLAEAGSDAGAGSNAHAHLHLHAHSNADAGAIEPQHRVAPEPRPVPWGRAGLALAVLMIAVLVAALAVNAPGRYLTSTVLAYAADGLSVVALILGIVGILTKRGRGAGIAAVVIAVLGNPLVLLYGLGALA